MTDLIVRIDIEDCSPDVLGETLREMTFVGEGFGCYSNFNVRPDAAPEEPEGARFILGYPAEDDDDNWLGFVPLDQFQLYTWRNGTLLIEVAWVWDGDGHLMFRVFDYAQQAADPRLPKFIRAVENTDCKKDYGWQDVT